MASNFFASLWILARFGVQLWSDWDRISGVNIAINSVAWIALASGAFVFVMMRESVSKRGGLTCS
jgi:hypothetical protein